MGNKKLKKMVVEYSSFLRLASNKVIASFPRTISMYRSSARAKDTES